MTRQFTDEELDTIRQVCGGLGAWDKRLAAARVAKDQDLLARLQAEYSVIARRHHATLQAVATSE